jgi:hypothetical protein
MALETCGSWREERIENSWRNGVICSYLGVIVMEIWLKDSMFLLYIYYIKKYGR